jgi:hypothetical protein
MALSTVGQDYFDHAKAALPRFLFQLSTAPSDMLGGYAAMMESFDTQLTEWLTQAYIKSSTGIWLDQHARDYGTTRRASEADAALRARLGQSANVVVARLLLAQVNAILDAAGYGEAELIELRRDKAFMSDATTGGTRAFHSRGYRMSSAGRPYTFIVILPFPTDAATAEAVSEYLRQAKAAGFRHVVERRTSP